MVLAGNELLKAAEFLNVNSSTREFILFYFVCLKIATNLEWDLTFIVSEWSSEKPQLEDEI